MSISFFPAFSRCRRQDLRAGSPFVLHTVKPRDLLGLLREQQREGPMSAAALLERRPAVHLLFPSFSWERGEANSFALGTREVSAVLEFAWHSSGGCSADSVPSAWQRSPVGVVPLLAPLPVAMPCSGSFPFAGTGRDRRDFVGVE